MQRAFEGLGPAAFTIAFGVSLKGAPAEKVHCPVPAEVSHSAAVASAWCGIHQPQKTAGSYGGSSNACTEMVLEMMAKHRESRGLVTDLIDAHYALHARTPGDIDEHLPVLYRYARECHSVVELGARGVVSTWAFLRALRDSPQLSSSAPPELLSVDLEYHPNVEHARLAAKAAGVTYGFLLADSTTMRPVPACLLFIDSWHVYAQLKRELALHGPHTKRCGNQCALPSHDTTNPQQPRPMPQCDP